MKEEEAFILNLHIDRFALLLRRRQPASPKIAGEDSGMLEGGVGKQGCHILESWQ